MAEVTGISWCDHTASPWYGCAHKVLDDGVAHPGCEHCYAELLAKRNPATLGVWGESGTRVKSKSFIKNLRLWNKQAAQQGKRVKVFPSLCDPFEDRPELKPWREEMFAVADQCPNIILMLLTKRPENVLRMWPDIHCDNCREVSCGLHRTGCVDIRFRDNVWLLKSVSNQQTAILDLLECRKMSPVIGISAEPLLETINLDQFIKFQGPQWHYDQDGNGWPSLNWVIIGGESGPGHRQMPLGAAENLARQCVDAGVACYVKQDSGSKPGQRGRLPEWMWQLKDFPNEGS